MKTIVKIEIVLLALVVLVAAGMILVSEGVLGLFYEPVLMERTPAPIAEEAPEIREEVPAQQPQEETQPLEQTRTITATRYFAYDVRRQTYLRKHGDGAEKLYPASITKLLSAQVVLSALEPADTVTVGTDMLELVQEGSSVAELAAGDVLTVEQLICAMMLPSGNDAAQVAAVAAGRAMGGQELDCRQAVDLFVEKMNEKARELGMENSHFENPDGWQHENHYTTMDDLVILCQAALQEPLILKYTATAQETVTVADRELEWKNTNMLLHEEEETYVPATIGLKTGYTSAAGGCLVTAFFDTDRVLLVGVFGCPGQTMDRYLDTVDIYNSI